MESVKKYKSRLFKRIPPWIREHMSIRERLALYFRQIRGYVIYYILDEQNKLASYCMLKHNYLNKYTFIKSRDVLINPYCTLPQYRNNNYASTIISCLLQDKEEKWQRLYALVKTDNSPSMHVLEKQGFVQIGYSRRKHFRHVLSNKASDVVIYEFLKQ